MNPKILEEKALLIESKEKDYKRICNALHSKVNEMSDFKDKDNINFIKKIDTFKNDFEEISVILKEYANFLRVTARTCREKQDEMYRKALKI